MSESGQNSQENSKKDQNSEPALVKKIIRRTRKQALRCPPGKSFCASCKTCLDVRLFIKKPANKSGIRTYCRFCEVVKHQQDYIKHRASRLAYQRNYLRLKKFLKNTINKKDGNKNDPAGQT